MERNFEVTASRSASRKLSPSDYVMEESTDEMVPNISDYNSQFQNIATQTDLTDHEAYLTEVIDNNNKRICKLGSTTRYSAAE